MYHIYCDFDATVTIEDTWDKLFKQFGDPYAFKVWGKFNTGEYTAAQCITEACATVKDADKEAMNAMFVAQPLRRGFVEFVDFCKEQKLPLTIVSDGFSIYIREIFLHHGIDIPYFANKVELTDTGNLSVEFPHARESCRFCGACKCGTILTTSADEDTIVYIGDGYSDHCPVEISDVVFARDMLTRFCSKQGIPHHPFEDFFQVQDILKKHLVERPKYKRLEATKKRKDLYKIE
jgi:2-hydroxy-3-keto-5-methylthiopentenyl-1-phosphate phosphatase